MRKAVQCLQYFLWNKEETKINTNKKGHELISLYISCFKMETLKPYNNFQKLKNKGKAIPETENELNYTSS